MSLPFLMPSYVAPKITAPVQPHVSINRSRKLNASNVASTILLFAGLNSHALLQRLIRKDYGHATASIKASVGKKVGLAVSEFDLGVYLTEPYESGQNIDSLNRVYLLRTIKDSFWFFAQKDLNEKDIHFITL